jgi:hypothetical protein
MGAPLLDHLLTLTDDVGILQHARYDIPNRAHGYCTDDVGRALIVANAAARDPATEATGARLLRTYLAYLVDARLHDGWFHNFLSYDRRWQDERATEDAFGRALWGLGTVAHGAPRAGWRALASDLLHGSLHAVGELTHLRSRAYAVLGLVPMYELGGDPAIAATLRSACAAILRSCAPGAPSTTPS